MSRFDGVMSAGKAFANGVVGVVGYVSGSSQGGSQEEEPITLSGGLADELDGLTGFDAEPEGGAGKSRKDKKKKKQFGLGSKNKRDDDEYGEFDIGRDNSSGSSIPQKSGNRSSSARGVQSVGGPRWNTSGAGVRASKEVCSLQDQPEQRRYGFRVPFGAGGRASFRGTCVGMMMGFKAGWLGGIGLQAAGGRGGGGCRGGRTCAMARGNAYSCGGAGCVVFLRIG